MPENNQNLKKRQRILRHRGRTSQIPIYLGKQLRFFVNESDWKVIPMAAIIAGLVSMVIRKRFFVNMEGGLMGAFALTCVAIWNGCFNSIQCVCRERPIVKREHRSGMFISSYVIAHMLYQLALCLAQTVVSVYIMKLVGVQFPEKGFMTPWMMVDIGITMLLIAYASDMMSLFISSVSHSTTAAMTVMPFVLIFQLVFSGGIIPLPAWSQSLSNLTISNYGIRAIAAQSGYNELPMVTAWNTLEGMKNNEIEETISVGQILDLLNSEPVAKYRDQVVIPSMNAGEVLDFLHIENVDEETRSKLLNEPVTFGNLLDFANNSEAIQSRRDQSFTLKTSVGELLNLFGEENVKRIVQTETAKASRKPQYERTVENIVQNWLMLGVFILGFAFLATLFLEMIDRDKR